MPNSSSYLAYPDVKDAFQRALQGRGIKLAFKDERAATRWVFRANSYRVLDRKENKKLYDEFHSMHGRSPYDTLKIWRDGKNVILEPIVLDLSSITDL